MRYDPVNPYWQAWIGCKAGNTLPLRRATCLFALTSPSALQKTACTIPAHDGPLAALAFNSTGSKLASASEKVSERCCKRPACCLCSLPTAGRGVLASSAAWSMESRTSELPLLKHSQQRRGAERTLTCKRPVYRVQIDPGWQTGGAFARPEFPGCVGERARALCPAPA